MTSLLQCTKRCNTLFLKIIACDQMILTLKEWFSISVVDCNIHLTLHTMINREKCYHRPNASITQMSSSPKCHHRPDVIIAQVSPSPKCHHRPNGIIAQMTSSPKCHHLPNVIIIIAEMPSSPKCHHRPNAIIAQISSSPKCHHHPNAIIAHMPSPKCHHRPMPSSPKCHHRSSAIIAQMPASPRCHHRPNAVIAQMPPVFMFALRSFNVFDFYTAHPPPCYFSFYILISLRYIMVCKVRWILQSTTEMLNHSFKVKIIWSHAIILRNHVLHLLAHWRRLIIG